MSMPLTLSKDAWPIVFTDLDGSLLDHYSYSFAAAQGTLTRLEQNGVAVIPNTSKTLAELFELRTALKNHGPFCVENGAAVYIPAGYFDSQPQHTDIVNHRGQSFWQYTAAQPREHWQQLLDQIESQFAEQFETFAQLGIDGIEATTGLSRAQATLANQRQFSEPVHWRGDDKQKIQFFDTLTSLGAQVLAGGRFLHVMDPGSSKANALQWLSQCYREYGKYDNYRSIAIGDSHNDISMLEAADIAAIIRSPVHDLPTVNSKQPAIVSDEYGPDGWQAVINQIIAI